MNFRWNKKIGIALTVFVLTLTGFLATVHNSAAVFTDEKKERAQVQQIIDLENVPGQNSAGQTFLVNGPSDGSLNGPVIKLSPDGLKLLEAELRKRQDFLTTQQAETLFLVFNTAKKPIFTTRAQQITFEQGNEAFQSRVLEVFKAPAGSPERAAAINKYGDVRALYPELLDGTDTTLTQAQERATTRTTKNLKCDLSLSINIDACAKLVLLTITNTLIWLFSLMLYGAAKVFDVAFSISVTNFANLVDPAQGIGLAIVQIWKIGRDLSNMFFIFLLVAAGLGTVLDYQKLNVKKSFAPILIIAVLINFSMPIARGIIDANNILAVTFYDKIHPQANCSIASFVLSRLTPQVSDTNGIYQFLNFTNFCDSSAVIASPKTPEAANFDYFSIIGSMVGAWFIITLTAFTFLMGAFLLIYRAVVFIFILALGPLAFLSSLIPRTARYYDKWWDQLINNAMFAPVYLFLLYFVFTILDTVGNSAMLVQNVGAGSITAQPIHLAIYYFMVFTLLNGATVIANDLAGEGAGMAKGVANWTMGYIKTPYTAAGAGIRDRTGRYVAGGAARTIANSEIVKNFTSGAQGTYAGAVGRGFNTVFGANATTAVRGAVQNVATRSFAQSEAEKDAKTRMDQFKGDTARQLSLLAEMEGPVAQKMYDDLSPEDKIKIEKAAEKTPANKALVEKMRKSFLTPSVTVVSTGEPKAPVDAKKEKELKKAEATGKKEDMVTDFAKGILKTDPSARVYDSVKDKESLQSMNNEELGKTLGGAVKATDFDSFKAMVKDLRFNQLKSFVLNVDALKEVNPDVLSELAKMVDANELPEKAQRFFAPYKAGAINPARENIGLDPGVAQEDTPTGPSVFDRRPSNPAAPNP